MTIHKLNLGTLPDGVGGDTPRSGAIKTNANFGIDENGNYAPNENAASRLVGTNPSNVMEVGAFGLGNVQNEDDSALQKKSTGFYNIGAVSGNDTSGQPVNFAGVNIVWNSNQNIQIQFGCNVIDKPIFGFRRWTNSNWGTFYTLYGTHNSTVDGNGFIKAASPIIKLFADKIELNDEAKLQPITFEKLGIGDYLIKGSTGFAQEGWYIEMPKDANGNVLVAVVYEQLANNDISVKTYDYMLNKKGRIVPDLETPLDIPATRWIDLRLQALPQPDIKLGEKNV